MEIQLWNCSLPESSQYSPSHWLSLCIISEGFIYPVFHSNYVLEPLFSSFPIIHLEKMCSFVILHLLFRSLSFLTILL